MTGVSEGSLGVEVRETPTFFGPAESPLFGAVHIPADGRIRGAVLVCGSLGKDAADSLRALRLLGAELASRGILMLRFDYLGSGDSSFGQLRSESLKEWQQSITFAVDYLRDIGVTDISALALRAGCLILDDFLPCDGAIQRVVYWDPPGTGRRYLREQVAFFKMAVGADDVPPGVVSMIGVRLSEDAARDFGALKIGATTSTIDRLVIGRSEGSDERVVALDSVERTETVLVSGFADCAQPSRLLAPISLAALDATVDWFDHRIPTALTQVEPVYADRATIPIGDGSGLSVVEQIERIGPHSMFAIRSIPNSVAAGDRPRPMLALFSSANNTHHGPDREWVDLARAAASATEVQVLRWDRRGAGESGPPGRDEEVYIYSADGIEDAIAATEHASVDAAAVRLVGLCSGAWYAAYGARKVGADSVVLVNVLLWSWRVKKVLRGRAYPSTDEIDWEQSPRANLRRRVQTYMPTFAWRWLGRTGIAQAPEVLLASLAKRGIPTTAILCPKDAGLFKGNRGDVGLRRLQRSDAPPKVVPTNAGDHAAYHQAVLAALRRVVLEEPNREVESPVLNRDSFGARQ